MQVTATEVQRIYQKRFSEADKARKAQIWRVIVSDFFQKWVRPSDVVLDLGCGYGEFLNYLKADRRIGVDLNPDSETHLATGVEFFKHSVCNLPFLDDNSVDVVFTSNLMEHLPDKRHVEQMMLEAKRVLKPGGHFVMMGPNIRVIHGRYWDFWDHVVPLSDLCLVEGLENHGYEVVDAYKQFLPYTTRSRLPSAPWIVRLYLKLWPAWRIFGGQFLIRARKPV